MSTIAAATAADHTTPATTPPLVPDYLADSVSFYSSSSSSPPSTSSSSSSSFLLPSLWNPKDKCQFLGLAKGNLRVIYNGSGKSDSDAASLRSNNPIPVQCGIFYFEVEIISKGRDGYIGVGFCTQSVLLNRLPGWEKNSWGYHGDDGNCFNASSPGKPYGPTFTTGDIIGCGINFLNMTAFYTKNGIQLGVAFRDLKGTLYPSVGLRTPGEVVETNFGQKRFKFDIEQYFKEEKSKLLDRINATPLPLNLYIPPSATSTASSATTKPTDDTSNTVSAAAVAPVSSSTENMDQPQTTTSTTTSSKSLQQSKLDINDLVLSYLIHNGYIETTRQFYLDALASRKKMQSSSSSDPTTSIPTATSHIHSYRSTQLQQPATGSVDQDALFAEIALMATPDFNIRSIKGRQEIRKCVLSGKIDAALTHTNSLFPTVLSTHPDVLFQLECRKFIEMIIKSAPTTTTTTATASISDTTEDSMDIDDMSLGGGKGKMTQQTSTTAMTTGQEWLEILAFGQTMQDKYGSDARDVIQTALLQTFSLIAYNDPFTSPNSKLLEIAGRETVADLLNSAILESENQPSISSIETIYRQACVVNSRLLVDSIGAGAFVNIRKNIL